MQWQLLLVSRIKKDSVVTGETISVNFSVILYRYSFSGKFVIEPRIANAAHEDEATCVPGKFVIEPRITECSSCLLVKCSSTGCHIFLLLNAMLTHTFGLLFRLGHMDMPS